MDAGRKIFNLNVPESSIEDSYTWTFHINNQDSRGDVKEHKHTSFKEKLSSQRISCQMDMTIADLRIKHQQELENLTLTSQPFKTTKLFILVFTLFLKRSAVYLLLHGVWLVLLCITVVVSGIKLLSVDGPHEKYVEEVMRYMRFVIWWVALGVASSIGLGSGLHTFVLYLGPHIALFTIKSMQCGRTDIKSAPYDTVQFKTGPSWLGKDCAELGPPLFQYSHGVRVPLSSILPQVQLEAILWGLGTALGELPPYFISKAASLSGGKVHEIEELDASATKDEGFISARINQIKRWFLSHAQYLNFVTVLLLASVPNPLFDLAGILCGQFQIPFWEFFLATMIGKAIIKTHMQTVFVISVCNNQLVDWIENKLIWALSFIPGLDSILPNLSVKLHSIKDKYLAIEDQAPSNIQVKKWDISLAFIWNTVVWFMLINFFVKIVNSTAQQYLKKLQDEEIAALMNSDNSYNSSG